MKKILIITIVSVFTMTGCKKDRTCNCTLTYVSITDNGVTQSIPTAPITYTRKLTKVSKNGAHCNSGTEVDTYDNPGHKRIETIKADCTLE